SDAPSAVLNDSVPAGTTFVTFTAPTGWTVATQPAPGGTGNVQATDPDVVAGSGPQVFTLIVATDATATGPTVVSNTATGFSGAADSNTANNTSTVTTAVSTSADLAVTKTESPTPTVFAGDNITYTITLTNNGPNAAQGVTLSDTVPPNTTFVSATPVPGQN